MDLQNFLHPHIPYHGRSQRPETIAFNASLQEFSQRVDYITGLCQGGKLSPRDAYEHLDGLWQALEHQRQQLLGS